MTSSGQDVFGTRGSLMHPQPARVLVAEDDSELRTLIVLALRDDGYQVTEAVDGNELLDGIAARDGQKLAPWAFTFTTGS